jgi:transcriptional regulator with XRE-family HTH domain
MTPQELFVTRLRRQRLRARVSVEQIAETLRIKPELVAAFENNDLSEWPRGLYSRAWVRAYAAAVDLDPVDTVDEFCRLFPHGDRRSGSTIEGIASIVASPSEYRDEFAHPQGRRATDRVAARS